MKTAAFLFAILPVFSIIHSFPCPKWEDVLFEKDRLSKIRILLLIDDEYGANFNVDDESMSIIELFESYGWEYNIVALKDTVYPCEEAVQYFNRSPVTADLLISEISDLSVYQALVILPGRSHSNLMSSEAAPDTDTDGN